MIPVRDVQNVIGVYTATVGFERRRAGTFGPAAGGYLFQSIREIPVQPVGSQD